MKQVSVVIPCFNEEERILSVIKVVLESEIVGEVIVVDDGSSVKTIKVLDNLPLGVTVIKHKTNMGKAQAMKTGLLKASGKVVAFVDADLRDFSTTHLKSICEPVILDKFDMVIGVREFDVFYSRLFKFSDAYAGERAFNRLELTKNIGLFDSGGYAIEAAFNRFYLRKGKVGKVLLKGLKQTAKFKKNGVTGLLSSARMLKRIVDFLGFREFIYQLMEISKMKYIK